MYETANQLSSRGTLNLNRSCRVQTSMNSNPTAPPNYTLRGLRLKLLHPYSNLDLCHGASSSRKLSGIRIAAVSRWAMFISSLLEHWTGPDVCLGAACYGPHALQTVPEPGAEILQRLNGIERVNCAPVSRPWRCQADMAV